MTGDDVADRGESRRVWRSGEGSRGVRGRKATKKGWGYKENKKENERSRETLAVNERIDHNFTVESNSGEESKGRGKEK